MRVCQKGRALSMQLYLRDEMKRLWQGMDAFMNQGVSINQKSRGQIKGSGNNAATSGEICI